jgi:Family of unknown function (DUF6186)
VIGYANVSAALMRFSAEKTTRPRPKRIYDLRPPVDDLRHKSLRDGVPRPTPYAVILAGFVSLLGAMVAVETAARAGREPFRPVGRVVEAALASRIGRWLVWGSWLWVGFHFLAR